MSKPIIVIAGGGHAGVVIDLLRLTGAEILGVADPGLAGTASEVHGLPLLGGDDAVVAHANDEVVLANGIGSTRSTDLRASVFKHFKGLGYAFATLVHPSAVLAANVMLGEGAQVMAGAIIQTGVTLGANTIVNTRASVDHDCRIGANVHIAPGATLSGGVIVADDVHIGTGAAVIHSITIGRTSQVGAGATVTHDLPPGSLARPAKGAIEKICA